MALIYSLCRSVLFQFSLVTQYLCEKHNEVVKKESEPNLGSLRGNLLSNET